jgi:hypothetical protein
MKNRYIIILMSLVLFLSTTSCAQKTDSTPKSNKLNLSKKLLNIRDTLKMKSMPPSGYYYDNMARFFSGRPVSKDSKFYKMTRYKIYRHHRYYMKSFWNRANIVTVQKVKKWRAKEVPDLYKKNLIFYPLSGADFINMYLMYPGNDAYLMTALNPPGTSPALDKMKYWKLKAGLSSLRRVIYVYGRKNYFQSWIMRRDMTNKYLTGTTPVLMTFMSMMGLTIVDITDVEVNGDGILVKKSSQKNKNTKGILISFKDSPSGPLKQLVYLRARITNQRVTRKTSLGKYYNNTARFNLIMKSAVYLLHMKNYQGVAKFIENKSDMVIQDDSGLMLRHLTNGKWNIKLYGRYKYMRVDDCKYSYQRDLTNAFKKKSYKLPFKFGYGVLKGGGKSNLLRGIRK